MRKRSGGRNYEAIISFSALNLACIFRTRRLNISKENMKQVGAIFHFIYSSTLDYIDKVRMILKQMVVKYF